MPASTPLASSWTSSANAYTSDNAYATSAPAKNATTAVKLGTFGFDATIPANATITGVTVTVEWKVSTTASIATLGAGAIVNGVPVGTELVNSTEPTADTTQSFAVSGLTRAQLANGVFGVRVRATRGNTTTAFTASLDAVSVTVDYTAQTPTAIGVTTDALGNLTARGADTFTYDQANRLRTATVAGVTETYVYDGDGVRFSRQVGAGPVTRYVSDINTSGLSRVSGARRTSPVGCSWYLESGAQSPSTGPIRPSAAPANLGPSQVPRLIPLPRRRVGS